MAEVSASTTELSNEALELLGHNFSLTSFDDDPGPVANACRRHFWGTWLEELESYNWNIAQKRVAIPALDAAPAFEFARQYPAPADCIRVRKLFDATQYDRWRVEQHQPGGPETLQRVIVTDMPAPLRVIYTFDMRDLVRAGPGLRGSFVLRLAAKLAPPVTRDRMIARDARAAYVEGRGEFRMIDAQESGPEFAPDGEWITARGAGGAYIQQTRSAD